MATQTLHPSDEIICARVEAYTQNHATDVRDLAEVIDLATFGGEGFLTDEEDSRCVVFQECIALYIEKHGIASAELSAALADWRATND